MGGVRPITVDWMVDRFWLRLGWSIPRIFWIPAFAGKTVVLFERLPGTPREGLVDYGRVRSGDRDFR